LDFGHDLDGYFASPALREVQNNLFFSLSTKEQGLAPSKGGLTSQVVFGFIAVVILLRAKSRAKCALNFVCPTQLSHCDTILDRSARILKILFARFERKLILGKQLKSDF